MGLKRKASFSLSPSSYSAGPSPSRDQDSPFLPLQTASNHTPSILNDSPYVTEPSTPTFSERTPTHANSRTRKRFRDGRPDEETIHQNTLSKLYAAQKQVQGFSDTAPANNEQVHGYTTDPAFAASSPSSAHFRHEASASLVAGPAQMIPTTKPRGQRSLDYFLTGSGGTPNSQSKTAHSSPTYNPPAPPLWHGTNIPPRSPLNSASIMTCEDCYAPLLTATYRSAVDTEMMDVDGPLIECEIDDSWECGRCRKRVCDTCAVRREARICLECANPGHGFYNAIEIGEKRWVGGIGWM